MLWENECVGRTEMRRLFFGVMGILHWLICFWTERFVFCGEIREHIVSYILVKIFLLFALIGMWQGLYQIIFEKESFARKLFCYSIPCLFLTFSYFILNLPYQLLGDELNIHNCIISYDVFPYHFMYFTGLFHMMSLMVLPINLGTVIIKVIFQSFSCGYCIYRAKRYFGNIGFLMYGLFCLFPVILYSIGIHRMHIYGIVYLLLVVKLLFDYLENKEMSRKDFIIVAITGAVLSIWRREGIYFVILIPILICLSYRVNKKDINRIILLFLLCFCIIISPEVIHSFSGKATLPESRASYISYLVNMCREGLALNKYPEQVKKIEELYDIEAIHYINKELGKENYADNYIDWKDGYIGLKSNYTRFEEEEFIAAVQYLIIHEPLIFLKTRVGTWNYSALEGMEYGGKIRKQMEENRMIGIVFSLMSNLYIPCCILMLNVVIACIRKKWLLFFLCGGVICHTFITIMLSPAGYFKYYYQMYLVGYLFLILYIISAFKFFFDRRKGKIG